jgi:predicted permease
MSGRAFGYTAVPGSTGMLQDFRYAVRVLVQGKAWSAMVIVSLALGIGANTTLFSATNGLLLRKVPIEDPDSLVRFRHVGRNRMANNVSEYGNLGTAPGEQAGSTFSYPMYLELRSANRTLVDLAAGAPISTVNVAVDGSAEIGSAYLASGNYQQLLGVRALRGRTLLPEDDHANAPPVATISAQYWARRFGNDPAAIGKVVHVNNTPATIVGVTSASFTGVMRVIAEAPDITLPIAVDRLITPPGAVFPGGSMQSRLDQPTFWWLQLFGQLRPGITASQVEGNLGGVFQQSARDGMDTFLSSLSEKDRNATSNHNRVDVSRLSVSSAARGLYDSDQATLRGVAVISGVVGLILLLVCANVANLLLSRATARHKEIAVRLSIGATRGRLIRQLLTESVLLASLGGALGLLVAYWGRQLLPGTTGQAPLDWRVMLFAAAVAFATGILFGLAPALRVTSNAGEALKNTNRTVIGSRTLLTKTLLVVQVAISLVLLIGAGLFLRTVYNLRQVDVGFNPNNLVLFRVNPQLNRYDAVRTASLYDQVVQRLRQEPGIVAVTLTNPPLLSGGVNTTRFVAQGRTHSQEELDDRELLSINRVRVAPNFFETMQMPLLRGRQLTDRDNVQSGSAVIINETAVRKFYPNADPIGQRFGHSPETSTQFEIVGVVRDAKYNALRDPAPPTMYVPYATSPVGAMAFVIRTAGDPAAAMPAVRSVVQQVDANLPLMDMSTQTEQIERRFAQERVFAQAYTLFGGLALLVAAIGLFGLMSYNVTRRTTEIGIRMALGAQRQTVLQMIMRESILLVVIGMAIGVAVALAAGRLVASLLFGLQPTDVTTGVVAAAVMLAVSAFASYLPARRAARLDPMLALRHE